MPDTKASALTALAQSGFADGDVFYIVDVSAGPASKKTTVADVLGDGTNRLLNSGAANRMEQRNGTNAQTTRLYNSFTDASNGEWCELTWTSNNCALQTAKNGTGVLRDMQILSGSSILYLGSNSNPTWVIQAGDFRATPDNTYNIGFLNSLRPKNLYLGSYYVRSTNAAVSAAGSTQGTATAITAENNNITTAAAGSGVILPTAEAGQAFWFINNGANAVLIYPPTGGTINALAANTGFSLAVGSRTLVTCTTGGGSAKYFTLTATG